MMIIYTSVARGRSKGTKEKCILFTISIDHMLCYNLGFFYLKYNISHYV